MNMSVVKVFFEFALVNEWVERNPARLLPNASLTVSFGGFVFDPLDVPYVGGTPGTAGLYQLAIFVSARTQTGNHQVVLTVYWQVTPISPVVPVVRR